jgi:hypothetical protein
MFRLLSLTFAAAVLTTACNGAPSAGSLRDSFAEQLAANKFVTEFKRSGDDLTFKAPRPDGTPSTWRVHIDSAVVEQQSNARQPYKGTVTSAWYANGEQITITGADSNLPIELTSNGLGQECWAFWEADTRRWSWE